MTLKKTCTIRCFFTLALAYAFAGCETEDIHSFARDEAAPLSDFLPEHRLLVKQPDTFPFQYFYLAKDLPKYEYVYVAPVNTKHLRESKNWAAFDEALNGSLGNDVDSLARFMRQAYELEFTKISSESRLTVVRDLKRPRTLSIETAIITITPSKAELNAVGLVGSFFIPGLGIACGMVSSGTLVVECKVRDVDTGKIVAMYADTESDPKALINTSGLTWTKSAQINMKQMAQHTAQVLSAKDYRTIKRDFPYKFLSLISDGDL